jgi:hypothetical protein
VGTSTLQNRSLLARALAKLAFRMVGLVHMVGSIHNRVGVSIGICMKRERNMGLLEKE